MINKALVLILYCLRWLFWAFHYLVMWPAATVMLFVILIFWLHDTTPGQVKEVIGDVIRGLESDRQGEEKTRLPDDPQTRRQEAAIQQVASESLQRERLQQMERDMVRDLNREKTLGGD